MMHSSTGTRKSWLIWGVGAGVYVLAVFHRTSMGVAGPLATAHFHLSATQLGSFVMLQLGIYALMQIPTGILVDQFGPRRMLLTATLVMGSAQVVFALVDTYPLALLARGLLGCGDAMTYISVLRLAARWFPARQYAVLTAETGLLGNVGALVATVPLTGLLRGVGWGPTFAVAGGVSIAYALLLLRPATSAPFCEAEVRASPGPVAGRQVWAAVKAAWKVPGERLGFWVHLTTMAGPATFSMLWGYPYLTEGLVYSPGLASFLLMVLVLGGLVASVVVGVAIGRRPVIRTPLAVAVSAACLLGWLLLIAWPGGHPPVAVVTIVILIFSVGGPASTIGFMLARDYNPRQRISTATGMVNVGGFGGSVIAVFLVGQILDRVDPGMTVRSLTGFRLAFCAVVALTAIGLMRILTWWRRARAVVLLATARGEAVPVQITAHRWGAERRLDPAAGGRGGGRRAPGRAGGGALADDSGARHRRRGRER